VLKFSFFNELFADVLFAESLYGLRRKSVRLRLRKGSSKEVQRFGLEKRQRVLSVFFLVFTLCSLFIC